MMQLNFAPTDSLVYLTQTRNLRLTFTGVASVLPRVSHEEMDYGCFNTGSGPGIGAHKCRPA
jgi:hypothetical protein